MLLKKVEQHKYEPLLYNALTIYYRDNKDRKQSVEKLLADYLNGSKFEYTRWSRLNNDNHGKSINNYYYFRGNSNGRLRKSYMLNDLAHGPFSHGYIVMTPYLYTALTDEGWNKAIQRKNIRWSRY